MVARAHVADGSGALAVPGQPRRGEGVERGALRSAGQERLGESRPPEDGLQRPHVEVLARVRARHQGDLRGGETVVSEPAGFRKGEQGERLDAGAQRHLDLGVAGDVGDAARLVDPHDVAAMDALHDLARAPGGRGRARPGAGRAAGGLANGCPGGAGRAAWWTENSATDAGRGGAAPRVSRAWRRGWPGAPGGERRGARPTSRPGPVLGSVRSEPRPGPPAAPIPARMPEVRAVSDSQSRPAQSPPVSRHPAVLHKLAILRDEKTEPKKFREVVRELSWLLGYEALADARLRPLRRQHAARGDRRPRAGRPDRARADPPRRPRHGRRDARADAHGAGLAPRACSATSARCARSSTTTSCRTPRRSTSA